MKRFATLFLVLAILLPVSLVLAQPAPVIEWQKSFGGTVGETANSVLQTTDGGFAFAGYTKSKDGDVSGNNGATDFWVVKLDAAGNLLWQQSLGGSDHEAQWDFQQTSDGGFIVSGQSKSANGDITVNKGAEDYWLVKLDAAGTIIWQKTYGGSGMDEAYAAREISTGGYIVAGYSESNDGDVTGNHGEIDYWVLRLDADGNLIWQRSLGGSGEDEAYYVQETNDGGFVIVGESESTDGDVTGNHGEGDYWVVKLNASGYFLWQKSFGGSSVDYPRMVKQTGDGGLVIAGWTSSVDGDVTGNKGDTDYWVIKLNEAGVLQWQKCLGGSDYDFAFGIDPTADNGFIVTGYTHSSDGDVTGHHGSTDYWLVKLDATGNLMWQKALGGSQYDQSYSVQQAADGSYIVAGLSFSNDGDVTGNHETAMGTTQDCWIVKLSADVTGMETIETNRFEMYPNPSQHYIRIVPEQYSMTGGLLTAFLHGEMSLIVFDVTGRKISLPTSFLNNEIEINISSIMPGTYVVQFINNKSGKNEFGTFVKL
jgi:hypothetical protein